MDVPFAVLLVAKVLERNGRGLQAAMLRLEVGELMIRAALDESANPSNVHLGARMAAAVALSRPEWGAQWAKRGALGVKVGVSKKKEATRGR